jgi:hypothetical protein
MGRQRVFEDSRHPWLDLTVRLNVIRRTAGATTQAPLPPRVPPRSRSGASPGRVQECPLTVARRPLRGSTTLVTTQRCLPILRSRTNPSFSYVDRAPLKRKQADGDFVAGGHEVVGLRLEVRERAPHRLEPLQPGLASLERLGHPRIVDDDVRRYDGGQPLGIAGVECLAGLAHECCVRLAPAIRTGSLPPPAAVRRCPTVVSI